MIAYASVRSAQGTYKVLVHCVMAPQYIPWHAQSKTAESFEKARERQDDGERDMLQRIAKQSWKRNDG